MRLVSGISTFCWRWRSCSSSSANFFVAGMPAPRQRLLCTMNAHGRTHLRVDVLAGTAGAGEGLEPRFDAGADERVQGLVWCLVAAEQVQDVNLRRERGGRVEERRPFDECDGHDLRGRVRQVRREVVRVRRRLVVCASLVSIAGARTDASHRDHAPPRSCLIFVT
jgi:hypothetical protein